MFRKFATHGSHHPSAVEVCSGGDVCLACIAESFEHQQPMRTKMSLVGELDNCLRQLPLSTTLRISYYLTHSTTFVDVLLQLLSNDSDTEDDRDGMHPEKVINVILHLDAACREFDGQESPCDQTCIAAKLHKCILTCKTPKCHILLLQKLLSSSTGRSFDVLQDPGLWGHLTHGLPAALKTNEEQANLIARAFSTILEKADEVRSIELIVTCLPNMIVALNLIPPTHCCSYSLLYAISQCICSPVLIPQIWQNHAIQMQLGEALQAIFASQATSPGVQELAIHLIGRFFLKLPESQKAVFLDDLCIVDWLLEAVRNGKEAAHMAAQCLKTHFFKNNNFQLRHFDTAFSTLLSIARKGQQNRWLLETILSLTEVCKDWEPDIWKLASVVNFAKSSLCLNEPHFPNEKLCALAWVEPLKWRETLKGKTVLLDANVDPQWAIDILALAACTITAHKGSGRLSAATTPYHEWLRILNEMKCILLAVTETESLWPISTTAAAFQHVAAILLASLEINYRLMRLDAHLDGIQLSRKCISLSMKMISSFCIFWTRICPKSIEDQIEFANLIFSKALETVVKEDTDHMWNEATEFVKKLIQTNSIGELLNHSLRLAADSAKNLQLISWDRKLSFPIFVIRLLLGNGCACDGIAVECDIKAGLQELLMMQPIQLCDGECTVDEKVRFM